MCSMRIHLLIATVALGSAALAAAPAEAPVIHFAEVVKANPLDPVRGAVITEVARGEQASVNVWQMTKGLPPHLHRQHEEVIIVQSGRARARIGDRTLIMQAGDILLIPKGTIHQVRALGDEPFRGISVFAPAFDGKDRVMVEESQPAK
jgi:mannose-6-phosphate isomerase-like protein (cupin superfamily)